MNSGEGCSPSQGIKIVRNGSCVYLGIAKGGRIEGNLLLDKDELTEVRDAINRQLDQTNEEFVKVD